MSRYFTKVTGAGPRAWAGVYALRDDDHEPLEPALTDEGASLILITGEILDGDGR